MAWRRLEPQVTTCKPDTAGQWLNSPALAEKGIDLPEQHGRWDPVDQTITNERVIDERLALRHADRSAESRCTTSAAAEELLESLSKPARPGG